MKSSLQKQIDLQEQKTERENYKLQILEEQQEKIKGKKLFRKISKTSKQKLEALLIELNKHTIGTWYIDYHYEYYGNFIEIGYYHKDCGYQCHLSEYMSRWKNVLSKLESWIRFRECDNESKRPNKDEVESLQYAKEHYETHTHLFDPTQKVK